MSLPHSSLGPIFSISPSRPAEQVRVDNLGALAVKLQTLTLQKHFSPTTVTVEVGQVLEFKSENPNLQHKVEVSTDPGTDTIFTSPMLKVGDVCRVVFDKVGTYSVVDPVYSFVKRGLVRVIEGAESDR